MWMPRLGNYRFEVQVFEDPSWPPPRVMSLGDGHVEVATPSTPQQVTWFYTADLGAADKWMTGPLGFTLVLTQTTCKIYWPTGSKMGSWFLGVCNSRPPPQAAYAPVTYSVITQNKSEVQTWHDFLTRSAIAGAIDADKPAEVTKYNVYGFDFYDSAPEILGKYRFNVQTFNDPGWPPFDPPKAKCGEHCDTDSDCDQSQPCNRCERFILHQCVT